mgnify:CR=1 FL=1
MQMLKEVFQREDERFNLKNGAICISIVVLIVFLAFALEACTFPFNNPPHQHKYPQRLMMQPVIKNHTSPSNRRFIACGFFYLRPVPRRCGYNNNGIVPKP